MAVIFELVVNFGANQDGVSAAESSVRRFRPVQLRDVPVPFEPSLTRLEGAQPYLEFSVCARGLGSGDARGPVPGLDSRSLTAEEITAVGEGLYGLLREFSGYRAAVVGWNPESLVDIEDLETDRRNDDPPGYTGLVLAHDLCERWDLGAGWTTFDDDHRWLPHGGWKNLW